MLSTGFLNAEEELEAHCTCSPGYSDSDGISCTVRGGTSSAGLAARPAVQICGLNKYKALPGRHACDACPERKVTSTPFATSPTDCVRLPGELVSSTVDKIGI